MCSIDLELRMLAAHCEPLLETVRRKKALRRARALNSPSAMLSEVSIADDHDICWLT
jgi:hypothetical protein